MPRLARLHPSRFVAAFEARLPEDLRAAFLQWVAGSRGLTSLYYLLKGSFSHEERAVAAGRARFVQARAGQGLSTYELRRNVHRLEKGLCTQGRRDVFALDYVGDMVTATERIVASRVATGREPLDDTVGWAVDVLAQYFDVVGAEPRVEAARVRFAGLLRTVGCAPAGATPQALAEVASPVSIEDLRRLVAARRSVRVFEQRPVARDVLDQAFEIAKLSPSACNRMAYEFRAYDDPELITGIVGLAPGMSGWAEVAPCLVVIVGKYRAYADERDRHLIYVDGGLAAMSLQLALVACGLASCCGNWPDIAPADDGLRRLLGLDEDEKAVLLLAVGYPTPGQPLPCSARLDLENIRSYNRT
jgi:nitroreductase